MKLKPIKAIFKKDLQDSVHNYQIILMVLTPVILSLLLSKISLTAKTNAEAIDIGVLSSSGRAVAEAFLTEEAKHKITFFNSRYELETAILEEKVRLGVILPKALSGASHGSIILLCPSGMPTFAVETLTAAFEKKLRAKLGLPAPPMPIKIEAQTVLGKSNLAGGMAESIFPMLIVMSMGMIGFLALPMAIAEEREKYTLNAIFLTPIKASEFILGKSIFSFFLAILSITAIVVLNGILNENISYLIAVSALGILMTLFIGLICASFAKTQSAVNAVGAALFLFFQMVPSLQNSSQIIKKIAPFVPSTYIFSALKKTLFLDLARVDIYNDLFIIALLTAVFYAAAVCAYKLKKADK